MGSLLDQSGSLLLPRKCNRGYGFSGSTTNSASDEVDTLSGIEEASLTGNSVDNTLDASAFTLGSVWLYGLNGDDTLIGGSQDDHLYGGEGDDTLDGGPAGYDTVYQTGTDIILTTDANGDGSMVTSGAVRTAVIPWLALTQPI
jgi:Ca2+-binding RTX toxin-like protein